MAQAQTIPIPTYPDLAGKVAVVTGGSKGIGAATCKVLAQNGVRVAVVARGRERVDELAAQLAQVGGEAIGISADCVSTREIERVRERTEAELGPADILVAFAGGFSAPTLVHEIEEEAWRSVIDSNLTATFLTVKAFLPGMMDRRRGAIVTMASNAGRFLDIPLTASYAAAKAGIVMLTRHVAKEVGRYGIRVNCVAPATTLSERVEGIMPKERLDEIAAMSPLGRVGLPEDSALATLYLVSESAAWLTGITLDVAGGRIML
jgi:3-oxoacyl-[acyl-carrier protein] reductase